MSISDLGEAGIAQSIWATGWTVEESGFDSQQEKEDIILSPAPRPAVGPTQPPSQWVPGGGLFPPRVKLTTQLHLVPRTRMVEIYLHSPTRLHGMVLN
jgi:hypothetical protein